MSDVFERAIITHCAPTLAGHKCGSLFSWHGCPDALHVDEADGVLSRKGVRVRVIRSCAKSALIYVYRPEKLAARLKDNAVREFLAGEGYEDMSIDSCLEQLSQRVVCGREFPHEIGVFLDYPLEDVIGFINIAEMNTNVWDAGKPMEMRRRRKSALRCIESASASILIVTGADSVFCGSP